MGKSKPKTASKATTTREWEVSGSVVGGKYLGKVKAATAEEALAKGEKLAGYGIVTFCHQCAHLCEDAQIETVRVCANDGERMDNRQQPKLTIAQLDEIRKTLQRAAEAGGEVEDMAKQALKHLEL